MTKIERVKKVCKWLIFDGYADNDTDLATKMGYTKSSFSQIMTEKVPVSDKFIDNICKANININKVWILNFEGDMLKTEAKVLQMVPEPDYHLIPLYDGFMTASAISQDLTAQSEPVEMVNAGDWFRDATSAMRVHGDSMFPDYVSGSIVAMKEVFNKRLVVFGQDYLIETSEYRVLKRLQRSDLADNWLLCSTNEDIWEVGTMKGRLIHEPFDIHLEDVKKICLVLGSVKRNHSSRIVGL